ncbi:MAG: GNAT family N-acetyltransferase [bacterium]|nr:ATP-binding protein [Candidatus Sumerlaeota bacterium]
MTLKGRIALLPAAAAFVRDVARAEGMNEDEARHFETIAEEAGLNVIRHALDGDEGAEFDIIIERRPAQLVLAVEDRGLPFDWKKCGEEGGGGFGMRLIKAFSDEVRYLNLGHGGKRLEFIRKFMARMPECSDHEDMASAPAPFPADMPITIRFMRPDEGVALARCMYHCYGYTYVEQIYFPEKIREMIESGLMESLVAVAPDDEIVGHLALLKDTPGARIAEIARAVVDPRCRGRKLFERMKARFTEHARERAMYGLYSEAVSLHPFTQKGNHALGATETGIMLAQCPRSFCFRDIDENLPQRVSTVIFYLRVNNEPERAVYPPYHHATMIRRIYEQGGFLRRIDRPPHRQDIKLSGEALLDAQINSDVGNALLRVARMGANLRDIVRARLRGLCLNKIDCIYLDLPLAEPATAYMCAQMELLGFFFSGIIPEITENGDVLRLQYLNNVPLDPARIVIYSDFAKDLLNYILKARGEQ